MRPPNSRRTRLHEQTSQRGDPSRTATGRRDTADHLKRAKRLDRLDGLARRMDRAFRIPFTRIRFGWDPILGLVPVIGDTLAVVPAVFILREAHDMGTSKSVLARMVGNIGIDWLVGLVPFAGDILDVRVKSNTRNMALLRDHLKN